MTSIKPSNISYNAPLKDWEQRKLNKVLKVNSGKDYKHLSKGCIPVYGTGGYMLSVNEKLSDTDGIGIGRKGTINKPQFLKAPFWTVDTLFYLTSLRNHDLLFLYYTAQNINWKKFDESSGVPSLSKKTIESIVIRTPEIDEQILIGKLLKKIDLLITLHQRKINILRKLKQQYLNLIFPKNSTNSLSLRFKYFDEPWEKCKLTELLVERDEKITETLDYPLMSFVQDKGVVPKSERYNREFLVKDKKKKYKKTKLGDFIYSSNNLETGSIGFNKTGNAVISPVYSIFYSRTNSESKFIGYLSLRKDFINKMLRYRQGVVYGQWRIHEKDFLDITISIPSNEEQNDIIAFLENLESYMNLQYSKIAKLEKLKKSYLRKMFL